MNAADTNVLVRLIERDDAEQVALAEEFAAGGVWVSTVVLVETLWVLQSNYDHNRVSLARIVEMLLETTSVILQDRDAIAAALVLFRSNSKVGFSDCLVLELVRKAGSVPLVTFDKGLARLEGTRLLR